MCEVLQFLWEGAKIFELSSQIIEVSMEVKKRIDNLAKANQVRIIEGNYIYFEGINISCINPAKVIIINKGKELLLLFYGKGSSFFVKN